MRLYKYLAAARTDVMTTRLIRFTQPGALNDPFEMRPFFHSLAPDAEIKSHFQANFYEVLREEFEKLPTAMKARIDFQSYLDYLKSQEPEILRGLVDGSIAGAKQAARAIQSRFDELIGLLCFTEEPSSTVMWGHYADGHKGFVMEFDPAHPFFSPETSAPDPIGRLQKIAYATKRPSISMQDARDARVFLTKSIAWKFEREWRLLLPLEMATRRDPKESFDVYLFALPPRAVRGVILGCRMMNAHRSIIVNCIRAEREWAHVEVQEAQPQEEGYGLDIVKVDI